MKEQLITEIQRKMLPYLNNEQLMHLRDAMAETLEGATITYDSGSIPAEETDAVEAFITAKQTVKKPSKQITLRRKEVTQLIGDELSNEEISEYFYFCLQRRDILEEWHKMYTEGKTDGSNA